MQDNLVIYRFRAAHGVNRCSESLQCPFLLLLLHLHLNLPLTKKAGWAAELGLADPSQFARASELQGSCRGARPGPANPRVWAADESLAWPARRLAWLGKTERRRIPAAVRPLLAVALRAPHTSPRSDQLGREHGGVTVLRTRGFVQILRAAGPGCR